MAGEGTSMRDKLTTDGIYNEIFDKTLAVLQELFRADLTRQRMDSVHIKSNMRHLGRIRLFAETIRRFLHNLKITSPSLLSYILSYIMQSSTL